MSVRRLQERHRACALALVVVVMGGGARIAAAQELITDRPDFTESSAVVGRGIAQIESGFSFERDGEGDGRVTGLVAPSTLARIGLSKRVELRLGTDGFASQSESGLRHRGMADFEAGLKIRLVDDTVKGFEFAVIPMMSLPTGTSDVTSGTYDPTVKMTWARGLSHGFDLSGNYNISSLSDTAGRFQQQALSVSVSHDLALGLGSYIEAYGFTPMARDAGSGWTIDGGIVRPFGANLQLDVEVGRGVTADAADWFVAFGFAVRGHMRHAR